MKKFFLMTTAMTMAAMPAIAAEKIKLGLGGYYRAVIVAGDQDQDDGINDHGIGRESEVYFSGKTKLDNGIKVGAMIQLEGETSGDQIDNSYIWASGNFGRIELGSTWGPSLLMSAGSIGNLISGHGDFASHNHHKGLNELSINTYGGDAGLSQNPDDKINYFTPRFSGFQLGLSYMPKNLDGKDESATALADDGGDATFGNELIDIAVNYNQTIGGISAKGFASYFTSETYGGEIDSALTALGELKSSEEEQLYLSDGDASGYSIGASASLEGFTLGGRYTEITADSDFAGINDAKSTQWRIGAEYGRGPWSVGVAYMFADREFNTIGLGESEGLSLTTEAETELISISGAYAISPGVQLFGGVQLIDQKLGGDLNGRTVPSAYNEDYNGEATIAVIGTKLSF